MKLALLVTLLIVFVFCCDTVQSKRRKPHGGPGKNDGGKSPRGQWKKGPKRRPHHGQGRFGPHGRRPHSPKKPKGPEKHKKGTSSPGRHGLGIHSPGKYGPIPTTNLMVPVGVSTPTTGVVPVTSGGSGSRSEQKCFRRNCRVCMSSPCCNFSKKGSFQVTCRTCSHSSFSACFDCYRTCMGYNTQQHIDHSTTAVQFQVGFRRQRSGNDSGSLTQSQVQTQQLQQGILQHVQQEQQGINQFQQQQQQSMSDIQNHIQQQIQEQRNFLRKLQKRI